MSDAETSDALRRRCFKPDPNRLGTWTARRLGRPAALHLTRVCIRSGISAHRVTAAAAAAAVAAVLAFCHGGTGAWLAGSWLLVVWYLLDHVDGQLARYHGVASLDGAMLDYAMHHGWNLLLPFALGYGLMRRHDEPAWCLAGMSWSFGATLLTLRHDVRCKTFFQRLKLLVGEVRAVGGGGGRPEPARWPQRRPGAWLRWVVLKSYEQHVVVAALVGLSTAAVAWPAAERAAQLYVLLLAVPAPLLAAGLIVRSALRSEAEREFAAWFRAADGATLELREGWWHVTGPASTAVATGTRDELLTRAASDS